MIKGVNSLLYQLWATRVTGVPMKDSSSIHYRLYPLSNHFQRMMRFSGSNNYSSISPYEASDLLYQISLEDFEKARAKAAEVENSLKATSNSSLIVRLTCLIVDKEYRNSNFSKKQLKEKEKFIQVSTDYLSNALNMSKLEDLPVGLASNLLFASARLGFSLTSLNEKVLPLFDRKLPHLHVLGITESLWAATRLGKPDLVKKLVQELEKRPIVKRVSVVTSPFNHLQYIQDPDNEPNREHDLLVETAGLTQDEGLKNKLTSLAAKFKS